MRASLAGMGAVLGIRVRELGPTFVLYIQDRVGVIISVFSGSGHFVGGRLALAEDFWVPLDGVRNGFRHSLAPLPFVGEGARRSLRS